MIFRSMLNRVVVAITLTGVPRFLSLLRWFPWRENIHHHQSHFYPTIPLFATGLGTLGLLGWRRKRKARAA
jgi:hypothetical protein